MDTNFDMNCSKDFDFMHEFKYTMCPEGYHQWTLLTSFLIFITIVLVANQFATWTMFALVDPFSKIYCCGKLQIISMSLRCKEQDRRYYLKYITDVLERKQTFEDANDQAKSEVGLPLLELSIHAGMIDLTKVNSFG